jgi:hypothetical protein
MEINEQYRKLGFANGFARTFYAKLHTIQHSVRGARGFGKEKRTIHF